MGANPTQAIAVSLFLLAFVMLAAGMFAGGSLPCIVLAVALLAASSTLFLKAKPWEEREN